MSDDSLLVIGTVTGAHGLKGWLKIHSWADPADSIGNYPHWTLDDDKQWEVLDVARQGKRLTARLAGVDNRDQAETLTGSNIRIPKAARPALTDGQFYWSDLIGLKVLNQADEELGLVKELLETGANDVLVVTGDRERLIPFVMGQTILEVDLKAGAIRVDWDSDY